MSIKAINLGYGFYQEQQQQKSEQAGILNHLTHGLNSVGGAVFGENDIHSSASFVWDGKCRAANWLKTSKDNDF